MPHRAGAADGVGLGDAGLELRERLELRADGREGEAHVHREHRLALLEAGARARRARRCGAPRGPTPARRGSGARSPGPATRRPRPRRCCRRSARSRRCAASFSASASCRRTRVAARASPSSAPPRRPDRARGALAHEHEALLDVGGARGAGVVVAGLRAHGPQLARLVEDVVAHRADGRVPLARARVEAAVRLFEERRAGERRSACRSRRRARDRPWSTASLQRVGGEGTARRGLPVIRPPRRGARPDRSAAPRSPRPRPSDASQRPAAACSSFFCSSPAEA